jgi:hypothetical protein
MRKWHWLIIALISGVTAMATILRPGGAHPAFYVGQTIDQFDARCSAYAWDQSRLPPFWYTSAEAPGGNDAVAFIFTTDFYVRRGHVFARRCIVAVLSGNATNGTITSVRSRWKWTPWSL